MGIESIALKTLRIALLAYGAACAYRLPSTAVLHFCRFCAAAPPCLMRCCASHSGEQSGGVKA